jgi:uncharacterized DUF497 family protein
MLRFDWDERKNKSNRTKHGVWFEEAQSVFDDPRGRLFFDPEHSEVEDRFILLGVSSAARTSRRSLLPGGRFFGPDYIRAESDQKGGAIL